MEKVILVVWCVLLIIQTIWDIKWKKIPIVPTVVGAGLGILFCIVTKRDGVDILWAMTPGFGCLMYSKISQEALGYGDSFLLCALGFFLDVEHVLFVSMMAFGLAGITAFVFWAFFKKGRNYEIPFVPFLALAYGWDIVLRI